MKLCPTLNLKGVNLLVCRTFTFGFGGGLSGYLFRISSNIGGGFVSDSWNVPDILMAGVRRNVQGICAITF